MTWGEFKKMVEAEGVKDGWTVSIVADEIDIDEPDIEINKAEKSFLIL